MPADRDESGVEVCVALTPRESKGLRMVIRWGCPDPMPPEIASALRKLVEGELTAGIDP